MSTIIDFHSHILPGMDDGSETAEMSEQMLKLSKEQGIDVIAATPHFYAEQMTLDMFLKRRETAFLTIQDAAACRGISLLLGAEAAFFPGIGNAGGIQQLTIRGTSILLLEMPSREWNSRDIEEVEQLLARGITPLLAHIERFIPYQKDRRMIRRLYSLPILAQVNGGALLNWRTRRLALRLFSQGMAHLLGSDCHNLTTRPPNLAEGRNMIEKKLGRRCLSQIDRLGREISGL
ncbi:MAG TPA: capsular polysaccharide biosynthesis protein [Candidatus Cottocaccamicrobium excrementipullorum]|nr:capsular polysaccharide biosynthesis protein [Candidatus Cottocaccamicrobium excrementipullorum]